MNRSTFYHDGWRDYERHNPASPPDATAPACEYSKGWMDACNLHLASQDILAALESAESFVAGFEDDETQEGIDALLATIRTAISKARGAA